jgi:hypothetical protein
MKIGPLEWIGNTLGASDVTKWVRLPPQTKKLTIGIGWPNTDTPIGTLAIEISNHGKPNVSGAPYPTVITINPAGTANTVILDKIETSATYIRMTYTRSSGGAGAVFTDDTGVAGTLPNIETKE